MYGGAPPPPPPPPPPPQQQSQQKHDIFVGNLAFNTTEEQLHQAFSEIGRVLKVRMVTDSETGKSRGFAFVEYEDPQAALSAIRNMNEHEINGRRIRVNFSNSSHLEVLAGKLGMDMPNTHHSSSGSGGGPSGGGDQGGSSSTSSSGTHAVADALKNLSKGEMYDVVAKLKEIADRDPEEARRILSGHPQLPEAMLHCMSKLDMIRSPLPNAADPRAPPQQQKPPPARLPTTTGVTADPRARMDPRAAPAAAVQAAPPPPPPAPPRADPRARLDPRAQASRPLPPPPPPPPPYGMPPQQPPPNYGAPPPPTTAAPPPTNLDPNLVQQVMSLTPQQIAQLPPDKQQSIMALRTQITGGR